MLMIIEWLCPQAVRTRTEKERVYIPTKRRERRQTKTMHIYAKRCYAAGYLLVRRTHKTQHNSHIMLENGAVLFTQDLRPKPKFH